MKIWRNEPNTKHAWAFIYYCRRQGDTVTVTPSCKCYPTKKYCGHPITIQIKGAEIARE